MRATVVIAVLFALAAAAGGASGSIEGGIQLDRQTTPRGSIEVDVGRRAQGPARYRDVYFDVGSETETQMPDGTTDSGGQNTSIPFRISHLRDLGAGQVFMSCAGGGGVYGVASKRVARVELTLGDGTVTTIRRRRAPKGWGRARYVFGKVVVADEPATGVRGLDRRGRTLQTASLSPADDCRPPAS